MTSLMALDGVTSFLRLKDVTIARKRMGRSLSIGWSSSVQWRKLEEAEDFECVFVGQLYEDKSLALHASD